LKVRNVIRPPARNVKGATHVPSPHANLATILLNSAARHPDRPAVRLDGATLRYAELDEASARAASLLRSAGVHAGDRVGLMLPNLPAFAILYYGILRAGPSWCR
jgi:long-chain acyl-CoA synthetase